MNRRELRIIMTITFLVVVYVVSYMASEYIVVNSKNADIKGKKYDYTIIIDPGHGGMDPGKVGVNGKFEKDINLQIAEKLKKNFLKNKDLNIKVVMTREEDKGLYNQNEKNKKISDMENRCKIINENKGDILVSIHQNSYQSGGAKGAQIFYYSGSEKGRNLASSIQKSINDRLFEGMGRTEKDNSNYYILLNVNCPAVIVECGFLSNSQEADLLSDEEYQKKMADAIESGVYEYFEKLKGKYEEPESHG